MFFKTQEYFFCTQIFGPHFYCIIMSAVGRLTNLKRRQSLVYTFYRSDAFERSAWLGVHFIGLTALSRLTNVAFFQLTNIVTNVQECDARKAICIFLCLVQKMYAFYLINMLSILCLNKADNYFTC